MSDAYGCCTSAQGRAKVVQLGHVTALVLIAQPVLTHHPQIVYCHHPRPSCSLRVGPISSENETERAREGEITGRFDRGHSSIVPCFPLGSRRCMLSASHLVTFIFTPSCVQGWSTGCTLTECAVRAGHYYTQTGDREEVTGSGSLGFIDLWVSSAAHQSFAFCLPLRFIHSWVIH